MSDQTVQLRVVVDAAWDAGDRIEVFSDWGTGTVDTARPLRVRGLELFPGQAPARPLGRRAVGRGRVGDAKAARRHVGGGRSIVGKTAVGRTPPFVVVEVTVPAAFGKWKFAVRALGRDGKAQSGAMQVIEVLISGTDPEPLASLSLVGHDGPSDTVTFDFSRSS